VCAGVGVHADKVQRTQLSVVARILSFVQCHRF
jgi:hypothetical protein